MLKVGVVKYANEINLQTILIIIKQLVCTKFSKIINTGSIRVLQNDLMLKKELEFCFHLDIFLQAV